MSVVSTSENPLTLINAKAFLDGVSARQRALFVAPDGTLMDCRIGRSRKVHSTVEVEWLGMGVSLLVPACGVGMRPDTWMSTIHPADSRADGKHGCQRAACRAHARTSYRAAPLSGAAARRLDTPGGVPNQLPLFLSA